jgi:CheY-like chemotaxis protein
MTRSGSFSLPTGYRQSSGPALAPGEVVASAYAIGAEVARTEDGAVFEARDMLLDRPVALKFAWRDDGNRSLVPEAKRCAAVHAPCAVQIHAIGAHKGIELVVAERVHGHLLADELDRPMPPELYLARLRALVAAVAHAHDAGIAVGAISGATVLVVPDPAAERPGAADRLVLGRLSLSQVPAFGRHGLVLAPEVARGEVEASDPAAAEAIDLYGLGCIAVELACGEPPFGDDDVEAEVRGHASEPPPRLADLRPDLPGELSDLVDWLLAKRPAARPRSARDVLAQLDAMLERLRGGSRPFHVLIVDDDTARARWLWSLARRAHSAAIVEIASEGTDAAHKLNRDAPELVFIDAALRGVMNALELCMYARGLPDGSGALVLIGGVAERDRAVLATAGVEIMVDDADLAPAFQARIRAAAAAAPEPRPSRSKLVSG